MTAERTDRIHPLLRALLSSLDGAEQMLSRFATPRFSGEVVAQLYADEATPAASGQVVIGAEFARAHGITDVGGAIRPDFRASLGSPRPYFGQPAGGAAAEQHGSRPAG